MNGSTPRRTLQSAVPQHNRSLSWKEVNYFCSPEETYNLLNLQARAVFRQLTIHLP